MIIYPSGSGSGDILFGNGNKFLYGSRFGRGFGDGFLYGNNNNGGSSLNSYSAGTTSGSYDGYLKGDGKKKYPFELIQFFITIKT